MAQTAYCRECGERVVVTETGRCPKTHGRECLTEHEDNDAVRQANVAPADTDSTKNPLVLAFAVLSMCAVLSVVLVFHRLTDDSRQASIEAFQSALTTEGDSGPVSQSEGERSRQSQLGLQSPPERVPAPTEGPETAVEPEPAPEPKPAPTEAGGLSLAERKAIFWDLAEAEDRAMAEADAVYDPMNPDYDNIMANIDLNDELYDRYYKEILRRYGISDAVARQIMVEGSQARWPTP